jgi:hypothetical protein
VAFSCLTRHFDTHADQKLINFGKSNVVTSIFSEVLYAIDIDFIEELICLLDVELVG